MTTRDEDPAPEKRRFTVSTYTARVIRKTVEDCRTLIVDALDAGGERREGAGITRLDAWMCAHPHVDFIYGGLWDGHIDASERLLSFCADMAESIAILLDADKPPAASPFVLQRSLSEALMRLIHIHDSTVAPARVAARMAAYQLETIEGNLRAAEAFGPDGVEDAKSSRHFITRMHKFLTDGGFELHPDRREPFTVAISIDGERENLRFNATAAFRTHLPSSPWMWELGSGVTHGRGWMLGSLIETTQMNALSSERDVALAVGAGILELADALAQAVHGHTGLNVKAFLKRNHLRRRGLSSWSPGFPRLVVDHREYAARTGGAERRPALSRTSFFREPNN